MRKFAGLAFVCALTSVTNTGCEPPAAQQQPEQPSRLESTIDSVQRSVEGVQDATEQYNKTIEEHARAAGAATQAAAREAEQTASDALEATRESAKEVQQSADEALESQQESINSVLDAARGRAAQ